MSQKYEVLTWTLCGGWVNCWTISDERGDETKQIFDTRAEAQAELDAFLNDIQAQIECGERGVVENYAADDFRIERV